MRNTIRQVFTPTVHTHAIRFALVLLTITLTACDGGSSSAVIVDDVKQDDILLAKPRAVPNKGVAPLTVSFYPDGSVDSVIESFEWDFDDDGVFEISEPIGRVQSNVFYEPGTYKVRLRVINSAGQESVGETVVDVINAPPEVIAEASPSSGGIPLSVSFSVVASDNEDIANYSWDFNGDGQAEESSESTGNTGHIYTTAGVHRPILTVTDSLGESTRLQVPTIEVRAGSPDTPSITARARPAEGKAALTVGFSAQVADPDREDVIRWEWDFNGDGRVDHTDTNNDAIEHTYTRPGEYYARVHATMSDGESVLDYIRINVLQDIELAVSNDTIDVDLIEDTTVTTTLAGSSRVSLIIENSSGLSVRSLVSNVERSNGTYDDIWDGTDDHGRLVPAGQYRAVLFYGDDATRFDLGLNTGGMESNPVGEYASEFAAFAADPLEIEFAIDQASEVTAFLGYLGAGTRRLFTFYQREPRGRGSHQIIWNGENEEGVLINPPGGSDGFLVGLFAYTLPDNAIVVKNAVSVNSLAAAPPILVPDSVTSDGSTRLSTLQFNLSRDARITHTVNNADTGEEIYRKIHERIPLGSPQLYWEGKNSAGNFVAPGNYRHGITAVDGRGNKSTTMYAMQRVYY